MRMKFAVPAGLILTVALFATLLSPPASARPGDREAAEDGDRVEEIDRGGRGNPPAKRPTPIPTPFLDTPTEGPIMFALGDSYASGEGVPPFVLDGNNPLFDVMPGAGFPLPTGPILSAPGDDNPQECHRSFGSAAGRLADTMELRVGGPSGQGPAFKVQRLNFAACSGAVIADLGTSIGSNQPAQTDIFAAEPNKTAQRIITVSIGGNDLGFAEVLRTCGLLTGNCRLNLETAMNITLNNHQARLVNAYRQIADANDPNGDADTLLLAVAAPKIFDATCSNLFPPTYSVGDREFINELAIRVNTITSAAVTQLRTEFADPASGYYHPKTDIRHVDMIDAFDGHGVCNPNSVDANEWVHGYLGTGPLYKYSFHPKADGQTARAEAIEEVIQDWATDNFGQ